MRVGDGRSISIWDDKWIPGTIRMSPMLRPTNTSLQSVHELTDDGTWTWKTELVRETFLAPDAEAILNIPIRTGGGEDFFAWAFENLGVYTVKSAYRALVNRKERLALEEGTVTSTSKSEQ